MAESSSELAPGRRGYLCGVACICFVAVVWTFATVLKQIIFSDLKLADDGAVCTVSIYIYYIVCIICIWPI
jgi:hypothetical protein